MAFMGMITAACVFLCLAQLDSAHGIGDRTCCTSYNRSPVPFNRIKGFKKQTIEENCDIEAIIFYTVKKIPICATTKDAWVRRTLNLLSAQLKKMAKRPPAVGKKLKTTKSDHVTTSSSGGIPSTTESSQSIMESSQDITELFNNY
uniref:Chemokine interleukin-8-like domain-containing protein n=1 Tax=Neogobius melanostomus TaxID=47308 RepID=A0A8C6THG2_9GOBI